MSHYSLPHSRPKKAEDVFEELKKIEENKKCFECGGQPTTWASIPLGIFLCLRCAGLHRGLGVESSFVRSLQLDQWKPRQLEYMILGGNKKLYDHFQSFEVHSDRFMASDLNENQPASPSSQTQTYLLQEKYNTDAARTYKEMLKNLVIEKLGPDEFSSPTKSPRGSQYIPKDISPKYAGATSISSDQLFGRSSHKEADEHCCCTIL